MERKKLINRRAALYLMAATASGAGALLLAEGVKAIDESMKPKYVLKGNPAPPIDDAPSWQRQTRWDRETNTRIVIVDGRYEK